MQALHRLNNAGELVEKASTLIVCKEVGGHFCRDVPETAGLKLWQL